MDNEYLLMWKDYPVTYFNTNNRKIRHENPAMVPTCIRNMPVSWSSITSFSGERVLQTNRDFFKEIVTSCNIEDQTDLNICIAGKALSFRDNYWIKRKDSHETWKETNLYKNPFSTEIAFTALTGEPVTVNIDDKFYTGELTGKGTRSKCFIRQNDNIFLAKAETNREITAEIVSSEIASEMSLPSAKYIAADIYGKKCSVCHIKTNENTELIHCSDYLKYFSCDMQTESQYYDLFMSVDPENFIKMQLFDYITLNTDRNRGNFGLKRENGRIAGLYPIYDHDSCFKGQNIDAIYFATRKTFKNTLKYLQDEHFIELHAIMPDIRNLYDFMVDNGKNLLEKYELEDAYNGMMTRIEDILGTQKEYKKEKSKEESVKNPVNLRPFEIHYKITGESADWLNKGITDSQIQNQDDLAL